MYVLSNFGIADSFIPNPKIHNYSIAQTENDIILLMNVFALATSPKMAHKNR